MDESSSPRFGTFAGVFRPVLLTILGALLYLREGWLVGNAGLGGALLVIAAAYVITGTTALSISSIATNLRVKAGGAFAIISAALGLEAGGAIGVPLFLAQTISSVMYLYAFAEGFGYVVQGAPLMLTASLAFVGVGAIVLASASLAARAQAVMLIVVAVAVSSAWGGWGVHPVQVPPGIGRFPEASLLECFALFFPAATGIMVGVGMSGNLEKPTRSIPVGTMSAWAVSLFVYGTAAVWYGTVVPRDELLTNKLAMVDYALVGPLVLMGLLSSTLMAALSSLVAAPRLLQAMAAHGVVPGATWLQQEANGEPRNATLATLALATLGLGAGSLDAIAPIITSFFIMTYLAVNLVVALEQSLGMVSWRPRFRIPTWIPVLGVTACVTGLVLSSPAGGVPEITFVLGIYVYLSRRRVDTSVKTVQSGIAQAVAAWAAMRAARAGKSPRMWKPDLLVPVRSVDEARSMSAMAAAITAHRGSIKLVALRDDPALTTALDEIVAYLRSQERFASWHLMPEEVPGQGVRLSINAMMGTFFAPNLLLLSARHTPPEVVQQVVDHARTHHVGVALAFDDAHRPFEPPNAVGVWLSDRSPQWELSLKVANLDLPVLLAYLLTKPTDGRIHLATVLRSASDVPAAQAFLDDLIELGRLPHTDAHVVSGPFAERLAEAPRADLHVFGLPEQLDLPRLQQLREQAGAPCLFVQDSGLESALA